MTSKKILNDIVTDYRLLLGIVISNIYRKKIIKHRKIAGIGLINDRHKYKI